MIGAAIGLVLEHLHTAGHAIDALLIADIARRSARWIVPRVRDRWQQADDDLRRKLQR